MKDSQNEQLIVERQREVRSANFIIYGIKETNDSEEGNKENDGITLNSFLEKVNMNIQPKTYIRLGKVKPNTTRPLKVVMPSALDKEKVMRNLGGLKGSEEQFGKINVRDDLSREEREEIKNWVKKANEKNTEENDSKQMWVVHGSPKNGLSLVKITRR